MRKIALMAALVVFAAGVIVADKPKDAPKAAPIAGAGVLTENKPDSAMIWIDGEDAPTRFTYAEGFDMTSFGFPPKCKGVFSPDRVQFTFTRGDDGNKLFTIKRAPGPATGTVTGTVQFSNDFWVAVKPKVGMLDGYAINWPPGEMVAKLKSLQKGDLVTVKFHTDVERHRIDSLTVLPPQAAAPAAPAAPATPADHAAPAVSKTPPTSRPEAATSQPTMADSPAEKFALVQMYLDNDLKDKARGILRDIIELYPDTDAARQAQAKLKALGG